jgi:hypothetical protein
MRSTRDAELTPWVTYSTAEAPGCKDSWFRTDIRNEKDLASFEPEIPSLLAMVLLTKSRRDFRAAWLR